MAVKPLVKVTTSGDITSFVHQITKTKGTKINSIQVAELALLAQLLPPCSPTCAAPDSSLSESCCSPIVSTSAAARRLLRSASTAAPCLRPLQLLLTACVCFSCYSSSASAAAHQLLRSASTAAPCLRPLLLLLATCVCFSCYSPIAPRLHPLRLLLLDCICLNCCSGFNCSSPIVSALTAALRYCIRQLF